MTGTGHSRRFVTGLLVGLVLLAAGCATGPRSRETFAEVPGLTGIVAVDAAGDHSLALTGDGRVLAWGDTEGGLGGPAPESDCSGRSPNGPGTCRTTPAPVPVPGRVTAIASADDHQAALTADGAVWAWGSEHDPAAQGAAESCEPASGPPFPCHRTPVRVAGLPPITAISAGLAHTVAIDRQGRVWQWGEVPPSLAGARCSGEPSYGRDYGCIPTPVVVPGLPPLTSVAANATGTLAIDADGGLWGWSGSQPSAAFGNTATPARIALPVPVADVSVGRYGTAVLGRDGSVLVTGRLPGLRADDCGPGCSIEPVAELPAGSVTTTAGPGGLRVRAPDGRVLIRDRDGATPSPDAPTGWTPDPDLAGAAAVANGDQHVLVLTADGRVLARGYDARGQLGV